jgi:hypothetical protein
LIIEVASPALQLVEKLKVGSMILTAVVSDASMNWRFMFLSDSLTTESCLLSSAKVKGPP